MSLVREISASADELTISWEDASLSRLPAIWLRDHCQMPSSRNPDNGQRLINITDIPAEIEIAAVDFGDGRLRIEFSPGGHVSEFSEDWLYRNCHDQALQLDDRSEIGKILWHGLSFDQGLPRCAYSAFSEQARARQTALAAVRDYGFVVIEGLPCESGRLLDVISRFGYVRETNYGRFFDVRTKVDPNNLAYTNLGLGCHLDNPYRDPVPGLQLLHCLESSTEGGESILQDGFTAATRLREENPDHFDLLCRHWVNFRFADAAADLRSRAPLIEVNDLGHIVKVRFNNRSIDTLRLPPELLTRFYPAYRHYAEILEREELQIVFRLRPGEVILFDNTRVLHARKAYSAGGTRHLQGAYSDLDGLYSCLRKLEESAA